MEQILKRSQQLVQGLRSPLGSAMVLSFVVHLAALPLLADWNHHFRSWIRRGCLLRAT